MIQYTNFLKFFLNVKLFCYHYVHNILLDDEEIRDHRFIILFVTLNQIKGKNYTLSDMDLVQLYASRCSICTKNLFSNKEYKMKSYCFPS